MAYNKKVKRRDAKEEVIYDVINSTRKQLIYLQLEEKFNQEYIDNNAEELGTEMVQKLTLSVQNMRTEIEYLLSKLKFYKKERDLMIDKKIMKEYQKYPKTVNMSQLEEIKE